MAEKDYFGWEEMKKETLCCTGHDSLEKAIDGCNNLEELFRLWKIAQMCETNPKSSFPKLSLAKCQKLSAANEFTRSFCADGFLAKDGKAGVPVLFICRESNISGNIKDNVLNPEGVGSDGQGKGNQSLFWLRGSRLF